MDFCFIDTETTGLYPAYGDRICEIALLGVNHKLEISECFDSLINPQRPISPQAYAVNRIEQAELENAPLFIDLAERIRSIITGRILVGHNVRFDYDFLQNEFRHTKTGCDISALMDTRDIAATLLKSPSCGLSNLIRLLKITISDRHRAMGDCRATLELFRKLTILYKESGRGNLPEMLENYAHSPEDTLRDVPGWLKCALEEKKEIEIEYYSRENIPSKRIIRPLSIFSDRGRIYLEAYCQMRRSKRTFLVDRIKKVSYLR